MDLVGLEEAARGTLDDNAYTYFGGGAGQGRTLRENEAAWGRIPLLPKVLRDVSTVSTSSQVIDLELATPIGVAPTAFHRLAHDDGEAATARGAAQAGALLCVSSFATLALEDIATAAPGSKWFQLYVHRDRGFTGELVDRAVAAGYRAIVLTVDMTVAGERASEHAVGFSLPPGVAPVNLAATLPEGEGSALSAYIEAHLDPSLEFDDVSWLAERSPVPVVVKGVLRPDDATSCVRSGAAAIVVSNHGGRQLDGTVPTARALPSVVDAVGAEVPVLVDGGLRRGTDVLRALALGATAVLVGRPVLWGLATAGADGVAAVLRTLTDELRRAMALCGVTRPQAIGRDLLADG